MEFGVYEVSLMVFNSLGSDIYIVVELVMVLGLLVMVDFSYINIGLMYDFIDLLLVDVEDWVWDFGDGGFSFEQNFIYIYVELGIYEVELEVFNSCGSIIISQIIVVEFVLCVDFISIEVIGCFLLEVKFIDLLEGEFDSWFWEFLGGIFVILDEQNFIIIYNELGVYDVSLMIIVGGEIDEIIM